MLEIFNELLKNDFVGELTVDIVFLRLSLAIIFGGLVGLEREKNNRPAGFRTHILVCFGAAVISMIQDQLRLNILALAEVDQGTAAIIKTDLGRLGAQVISGIGFLGAGSIIKGNGENIGGMTTAAGIWATGCVGLGIGWGFYNIAAIAIGYILIVMVSFKKIEAKLIRKSKLMTLEIKSKSSEVYSSALLDCYEILRKKSIGISKINKNLENNLINFTVNLKGRTNLTDLILDISSSKYIESVKEKI